MTAQRQAFAKAIREYIELGLCIMPIRARTKFPPGEWGHWAHHRPTLEQWRELWAANPDCNLALVYSSSAAPVGKQLVCVDSDTPEAEAWVRQQVPLPQTPTVQTARGWHRYYYAPAGLEHYDGDETRPEIRAGVHYTLVPPSIHPNGAVYEWAFGMSPKDCRFADLPDWGVALMGKPDAPKPPVEPRNANGCTKYGEAALQREADALASTQPGCGRNTQLNKAAYACGQLIAGGELDETTVRNALLQACQTNGLLADDGARACDRTMDSGLKSGKADPRTAPGSERREAAAPAPAPVAAHDGADEASLMAAAEAVGAAVNAIGAYTPPAAVKGRGVALADVAGEYIQATEERRMLPGGIHGLRTGWPTVDEHFGGFAHQGLILIPAGSGVGKTTVARHILFATCDWLKSADPDGVLVFFALERGREELLWNYAAYEYGLPLHLFDPGGNDRMTDEQASALMDAYSDFFRLPLVVYKDPDGDRMLFEMERLVRERPVYGFILDHVQKLQFSGSNRYEANNRVADRVSQFCESTGVPFVALSQVNEFKGEAMSPRGGPEWYNNADCVIYIRRGDPGDKTKEQKMASPYTRLVNHKLRHASRGVMPEVMLQMDKATKRLWECTTVGGYSGQPDEAHREWHDNG